MKRLTMLVVGCSLLILGGLTSVLGQKDKGLNIPEKKDLPKLFKELKDKDGKVRADAAQLVGNFGQVQAKPVQEAVPALTDMVKSDTDAGARRAAADALGKIGFDGAKTVPVLIETLKNDADYAVRSAAATSLGQFGKDAKEGIPALQEAIAAAKAAGKDDKNKAMVGKAAQGALKMLKGI